MAKMYLKKAPGVFQQETVVSLPENVKAQADYFLGSSYKVEEKQVSPENKIYAFSYSLDDPDNLFSNQAIEVEVRVNSNDVVGARLGNVEISLKINGQDIDFGQIRNSDSQIELRWGGGTGTVRKDRVVVNSQKIPDIKFDKFKTAFDLIILIHESSHTNQPVELLLAAENETDLKIATLLSKAMEKDAWDKTKKALETLGLQVDENKLSEMMSHFCSQYEAAYRAALAGESYESLPEEVTMEEALNIIKNKATTQK